MKSMPILFVMIVLSVELSAQNFTHKGRNFDKETGLNFSLTARKGLRTFNYSIGMPVRVETKDSLGNPKIIKGYITSVMENAIEIGSFQKYDSSFFVVSLIELEKVRELSRKERQQIGWWVGGAIVYSGVMYSILNKPLSELAWIPFIPAMGVAVFAFYYYPATFLWDAINEKSKNRGWEFSVRNY